MSKPGHAAGSDGAGGVPLFAFRPVAQGHRSVHTHTQEPQDFVTVFGALIPVGAFQWGGVQGTIILRESLWMRAERR